MKNTNSAITSTQKQKRFNRKYAGRLTIRQKEINTNRAFALLVMWFVFTATYTVASVSNSFVISNDGVVSAETTTAPIVAPERAESEMALPEQVNTVMVETKMYKISAYSEYDSCHYPKIVNGVRKCLTASGKIAEEGMIATNLYPFGTKIIIGSREFTVEDRISRTYNNRLDIFMGYGEDGYDKAINWGVKSLSINVIK